MRTRRSGYEWAVPFARYSRPDYELTCPVCDCAEMMAGAASPLPALEELCSVHGLQAPPYLIEERP